MHQEDQEDSPPDYSSFIEEEELPTYKQLFCFKGWKFVIKNCFGDSSHIFISKRSSKRYHQYCLSPTSSSSSSSPVLQNRGCDIPMFIVSGAISNARPLVFKKYNDTIDHRDHPFDLDNDYYTFCTVYRHCFLKYSSFRFRFTTDPNNKHNVFEIIMFSHNTLPISDYIYNGERF
ncbi:uncharacterized protein SPAPADRAFT_58734, partial [Spathaspora passalidarum NRRL Y-27907]